MFSKLANNYLSLPVTIVKGKDIFLWDKYGKRYIDLLSGYSAVNQGHCHPKIVKSMIKQAQKITLTSRVVHSDSLHKWADHITNMFQYDCTLAMNSGAEAVETALKLARRYGKNELPYILCLTGNFHGRTLGTVSLSDYPSYKQGFGPFIGNIIHVKMNDVQHLQYIIQQHASTISALLYEPVQGEGGVVPMTKEFIEAIRLIKQQHPHILLMSDEIQCGLGRSGYLTASQDLFHIRPDVLILGKALSGGLVPMSCILANKEVMSVFTPGSHGSTFGGNPLASAISITALDVIQNECVKNVQTVQHDMKDALHSLQSLHSNAIKEIRGIGLFWGVQFKEHYDIEALRLRMLHSGYVTCTSRQNTLRITPPLTITSHYIKQAINELSKQI